MSWSTEPDFVSKNNRENDLSTSLLTSPIAGIHEHAAAAATHESTASLQGEKQPHQLRDLWAAILFGIVQIVVITSAIIGSRNNSGGDTYGYGVGRLARICSLSGGLLGMAISAVTLSTFVRLAAHYLLPASLVGSVVVQGIMTLYFARSALWWLAAASCCMTAINAVYARAVWRRLPVAAAHLQVAMAALHPGLFVVAYGMVGVAILYSSFWGWNALQQQQDKSNTMWMIVLLIIYAWTVTVLRNILHVTVSGVVGTFVFCPNDIPSSGGALVWNVAITDSLFRACTFALGSICLGSLLTAILTVAYEITRALRRMHLANEWILCVLECMAGFLERLVVYFNKYAYVYVALYGYDYLTAGHKVAHLLKTRGLTVMINDDLVQRALIWVALLTGSITGAVGYAWADDSQHAAVAFGIPFCTGMAVSFILLSVVASAVDTVVVSYAEAPVEFERNHPGLAAKIKAAYREVYPEIAPL